MPAKGIGYMPVRIVCRLESIRFRFYRRENPLGILADIFVSLAGDDEDFAGLFSWLRIQISYICILMYRLARVRNLPIFRLFFELPCEVLWG